MRRKEKNRNPIRKILIKATILLIVAFCVMFIINFNLERRVGISPDYHEVNIEKILKKDSFTDDDYQIILMQTGLGKAAVDTLVGSNRPKEMHDFQKSSFNDEKIQAVFKSYLANERQRERDMVTTFELYQENFFIKPKVQCRKIGWITYEETIINEEGKPIHGFQIPEIKNGDVLITQSTHSIGWRHGHAAMVTNASKGEVLEATLWGQPSAIQSISNWQSYSSFILLRPKEGIDGEVVSQYALKNLKNIPYGLFTGIPVKGPSCVKKTQCAHLIWYPYHKLGYEIDSDGGWLVTPKDIAGSDLFDIVQVYGVNPNEIWP